MKSPSASPGLVASHSASIEVSFTSTCSQLEKLLTHSFAIDRTSLRSALKYVFGNKTRSGTKAWEVVQQLKINPRSRSPLSPRQALAASAARTGRAFRSLLRVNRECGIHCGVPSVSFDLRGKACYGTYGQGITASSVAVPSCEGLKPNMP